MTYPVVPHNYLQWIIIICGVFVALTCNEKKGKHLMSSSDKLVGQDLHKVELNLPNWEVVLCKGTLDSNHSHINQMSVWPAVVE